MPWEAHADGYLDIATNLKRLVRAKGKRAFTFVMGKLNVSKMANFMEVDVFVLVSSPENALMDSRVRPRAIQSHSWIAAPVLTCAERHRPYLG